MGKSLAAARNLALLRAQGNWITFLDSDDLWKPQKLQIQLQMMKDHNWDFSVTGFSRINQQSRIISAVSMPKAKTDYWDLLKNNSISCLTVMISRKALGQSQFADSHQEDFIMWLEILKKGFTCQGIMQELALYRVLPNSRSSRVNRPLNRWKIMRQREKLSFPLALYYWLTYVFSAVAKRM
jgi:teichuronic acid biosynthesis glycosyltransferase TuaG